MNRTIVVDVDGVLLDIHSALETRVKAVYPCFSMRNVKTYDFNKSCDVPLMADRAFIYEQFKDVELFKAAPQDLAAVEYIRSMAGENEFYIYTLSYTKDVMDLKLKLFDKWFSHNPNIHFINAFGEKKPLTLDRISAVVEDCHQNLEQYPSDTDCYLVDKPYNRTKYNDVLKRAHRCKDTITALKAACE